MVTTLRPHDGVKCPILSVEELEHGVLISVGFCKECPNSEEIRQPWRGFAVKCKLDGKSDSRTVEYE